MHPPLPPTRDPEDAIRPFKENLALFVGTPSGVTTMHVEVSDDPPGESFGLPAPNASHRKTDLTIHAVIGPVWFDFTGQEDWQNPTLSAQEPKMIALGATPIEPPAPAEAAWEIAYITKPYYSTEHTATFQRRTCLKLGNHIMLTPRNTLPEGKHLIEHIRQASIDRLQGPPIINQFPWITAT